MLRITGDRDGNVDMDSWRDVLLKLMVDIQAEFLYT